MSLLFDVWLVTGLTAGLLDEVLADTELNGDDFGMYSLLRRFGPATPTQLHRWTGLRPTTISAHLKRLDGRGHVSRLPNPADRRSVLVRATPAGRRVFAAVTPQLQEFHRRQWSNLSTAEVDTLDQLLAKALWGTGE